MACGMLMLVAASTRTSTFTGAAAAQARELAILQHLQQLGLQRRRHLADFVQQDRALVAQLELAGLGLVGAGESAGLVAEQLALQQLAGHRGTVYFQESAVRALGVLVDEVGEHFLASAAFPQQSARGSRTWQPAWPGREAAASAGSRKRSIRPALTSIASPAPGPSGSGIFQAEAEDFVHLLLLHGLGEIILRAQAHGLRHLAGVAHAGEHDDLGGGAGLADALQASPVHQVRA